MHSSEIHSEVEKDVLIDNRYQVIELLSTSESQVLLSAYDTALDNEIIQLKVFHISKETKVSDLTRFRKEVILTRRLAHPNIGRVYDFGKFKKEFYFISQENLKGELLSSILKSNPEKLTLAVAINIIYQLSNALIEAHSQGIIHRSISAENVIVNFEEDKLKNVYLINFSSGKILDEALSMTRTGELIGSPAYMAPEQLRGEKLDSLVDQYALGILAFEIITGKKPLGNASDINSQLLQLNKEIPELTSIKEGIPKWLNELVKTATAKNKNERFSSMTAFRNFILNKTRVNKSNNKNNLKVSKSAINVATKIFKYSIILLISLGILKFSIANYSYVSHYLLGTPLKEQEEDINSQKILSAVLNKDESRVSEYLKSGISIHTKDKRGVPLIILATSQGNANLVYLLLEYDKSILNDTDFDNRTALTIAVLKGKLELVELLINHGANLEAKDNLGKTALDYAIRGGNKDLIKLFEKH